MPLDQVSAPPRLRPVPPATLSAMLSLPVTQCCLSHALARWEPERIDIETVDRVGHVDSKLCSRNERRFCDTLLFEMRNAIDLNPVPHDQNTSERGGKNYETFCRSIQHCLNHGSLARTALFCPFRTMVANLEGIFSDQNSTKEHSHSFFRHLQYTHFR